MANPTGRHVVVAAGVALAGNLALMPLRSVWCGPHPANLWCLTEAFLGPWQVTLCAAGVVVGLLVGVRWGAAVLVAANLIGYLLFLSLDPWVADDPWARVGPLSLVNSLITGCPAALFGLIAGAGLRWITLDDRRSADRPASTVRPPETRA